MAFHFPLMPRMFMAIRQEDRHPITEILRQTPDIPENCQWAMFLRNHDELTLEMVTDEERDYMYQAYAADPQMRINVGIRRRLAPLLENSRRRIELMNALLFSMPGTPVIYYGDEIGMGDNIYLGDRNGVRTPMQWTGDRNGGFSRADPARLYAPPIMDPVYGYQAHQRRSAGASALLAAELDEADDRPAQADRRCSAAARSSSFRRGTARCSRTSAVMATKPSSASPTCRARCSRSSSTFAVQGHDAGRDARDDGVPANRRAAVFLTLGPYAFYWFRLQQAPAAVTARVAPETAGDVPHAPGAVRRRRVGNAARGQRADADRTGPAYAVPAASALVRRQGAADAQARGSSTGACCGAARSRSS